MHGQMVHSTKRAREGGLASLIRTGDHKNSFSPGQPEAVADDRLSRWNKFRSKGKIEPLFVIDLLVSVRDQRIAELQPCSPHHLHIVLVCNIELYFPVEFRERRVCELRVLQAELLKAQEYLRVEKGYESQAFASMLSNPGDLRNSTWCRSPLLV